MPNIGRVIRAEIARMVNKEVRGSLAVREVKLINRRLIQLEKTVTSLGVQVGRIIASGMKGGRAGRGEPRRGRQFKATPESLRKLRAKLAITQGELAKLLGVSGNAAWQWEAGRAKPRGKSLKAIQALGKIGKREARRRVESM